MPKEAKERTLRRLDGLQMDNVHANGTNTSTRNRSPREDIFWVPPSRTRRPHSQGHAGDRRTVVGEIWPEERGRRGNFVEG